MTDRAETITDLRSMSDAALREILRRTIEPVLDANDRQREMGHQLTRMARLLSEELTEAGAANTLMTGERIVKQGGWLMPDTYESFSHTPHWVLKTISKNRNGTSVKLAVLKTDGALASVNTDPYHLEELGLYEATSISSAQFHGEIPLDILVPREKSDNEESAAKYIDSWTDAFGLAAEYYVTKSRVGREA